jgi:hypothetical protein
MATDQTARSQISELRQTIELLRNQLASALAKDQSLSIALDNLQAQLNTQQTLTDDVASDLEALRKRVSALEAIPIPEPPPVEPPPVEPPPVIEPGNTPATTVRVKAGESLQAALDKIVGPTNVLIQPGIYRGNFVLRNKSIAAPGWITIRPDVADSALAVTGPPWITPGHAASLVRLESSNSAPTLTTEDGAHRYNLLGIDFAPNLQNPSGDLVILGRHDATAESQLASEIVFDRCYFHGDPVKGQHRGVAFHVINGVIKKCYFEKFIEPGRDSQAVASWNSPGPFLLEDSFFEATGENVLFGGSDPRIQGLLPSDIIIRGCLFHKDPAWKGKSMGVKNLLEFKVGRRIHVYNNVFENNWADAQAGAGLVFTVRNQDGTAPWSTIEDLLLEYNVIRDVDGPAINTLGWDDHAPTTAASVQAKRLTIQNNLFLRCRNGIQINRGFQPTTLKHNTFTNVNNWFLQFSAKALPSGNFVYEGNVVKSGDYGITGDGTGLGTPALEAFAPGYTFVKNVIESAAYFIPYPSGNTLIGNGTLDSKFDARKRYTGSEVASDGQKVGADVDGLIARIPWATW